MVAGRLRCTMHWSFLRSALLLLGACLHDVEASSCQRVIHKKVGDTVELPSCSQTEGITVASWKYGESRIADKDINIDEPHFKGRLTLNRTTFSLTVRALTVQDTGDFSFFGEMDEKQLDTVTITLKVHEPITKQPVLTSSSTWHASSGSCTVFLECSAAADGSVAYNWTVRNRTISGSRLQYTIREQDVDTKFTCTVSNFVSELSTSTSVKCSNVTQREEAAIIDEIFVPLTIRLVIGVLLVILLLFSLLCCTKSKGLCCNRTKRSQMVNQDETQQPVYSSLLHGDSSVYGRITTPGAAGKGGACVSESIRGPEEAGKGP